MNVSHVNVQKNFTEISCHGPSWPLSILLLKILKSIKFSQKIRQKISLVCEYPKNSTEISWNGPFRSSSISVSILKLQLNCIKTQTSKY